MYNLYITVYTAQSRHNILSTHSSLCVCVTCQGADVFTGVVFADSLLLCDVAHRHIETQTVFIWRLQEQKKKEEEIICLLGWKMIF